MSQALYDLPEGWEWVNLETIFDTKGFAVGKIPKADFGNEGSIPIIDQSQNFIAGYTETSDAYVGRLPVIVYGDHTNSLKYIDFKFICGADGTKVLSPKESVYARYAYYVLERFKPETLGYRRHFPILKTVRFPLPPLAEQTRIVEKLDAVLSRIDTAIDELQQSLALVDAMFKSGLDKAFNPLGSPTNEAGLYDLPEGWEWEPLKSVCKFENGDRGKNYPSRDAFVDSGIAVINAGALNGKTVDESELNFITRERFDLLGGGKVRRGDLLFCLRGSLGKCAIVTNLDEGAIASSLVIVRPIESILAEYLLNYFNSSLVVQFITKYNNGAAQPNLSAANLAKFELPLPPLAEQNRIVEVLDALNDKTTQLKTELTAKIGMFNQLKASVLDGAFRGEV